MSSPLESTTEPLPPPSLRSRLYRILNKKGSHPEKPHDGGLIAWLQVVACFLIFMNTFGLSSAFGVYQAYYQKTMLSHHTASAISWIGTLQVCLTLLVGILSGPLFDAGYYFSTVSVASVGLVFSFMMLSISTQYWQVFLCQGLLAGICSGMLYVPSVSQIPLYFSSNRGLAIGLVLSGAPVGGIVYPLIFSNLLASLGFGWATRVIGFLAMGFLTISILLIKPLNIPNRPKAMFDPSMFRDPNFMGFVVAGFFVFSAAMIPYFDSGIFWLAKIDHNLDSAFHTSIVINAGNLVGRILFTTLTDYGVGPETLMLLCIAAMSVLGFGWIGVTTRVSYYVFLVLFGFASAGCLALPACVMPYLCPRPEVFATRLGLTFSVGGIGGLVGVPIANALVKGTSDFLGVQLMTGIAAALGAVACSHAAYGTRKTRKRIEAARRTEEGLGPLGVQAKA